MPKKTPQITAAMEEVMISDHNSMRQCIELARAAVALYDAAAAIRNSSDDLPVGAKWRAHTLDTESNEIMDELLRQYAKDCGLELVDPE